MVLSEEKQRQYDEHLQDLRSRLPEFLRLHDLPLDKNFVCVNPNHVHKKYTGSMSYDKGHNKVHCFGNCEANPNFDIFDMAGFLGNCTVFADKVKYVEKVLGVDPVSFKAEKVCFLPGNHNFLIRDGLISDADNNGKPLEDYTGMINAGLCNIKKAADYLESRGIRRGLSAEYCIGYLPKFNFLGVDGVGLVIPGNQYYLSVRDITGAFKDRYLKFGSGDMCALFNPDAIIEACESGKPVFVTEGELDALSVITAGGFAVAMRGKSVGGFLKAVDFAIAKTKKKPVVILACDNDDVGMAANRSLFKELKARNVTAYWFRVLYCGFKDLNDALMNARNRFMGYVKEVQNDAGLKRLAYYQKMNGLDAAGRIYQGKLDFKAIDTGFSHFNKALSGGLYPWIYFLGAMPATGKSTFALQLAENISKSGIDVMYFGMEMSQEAIVSRSLSRLTFLVSRNRFNGDYAFAKSSIDLIKHDIRPGRETEVFDTAYRMYDDVGYRLLPVSGIYTGSEVYQKVKQHREATGVNPVVFVDYLQIMGNPNALADKQAVDNNIKGMVPIVTDFKVPLFIISSFNRVGYGTEDMTAFNASGGIESFADVLMVLTYAASGSDGFSLEAEKSRKPRKMKVKFLKNRYGNDAASVPFDYYSEFNCFLDSTSKLDSNALALSGTVSGNVEEDSSVFVCK